MDTGPQTTLSGYVRGRKWGIVLLIPRRSLLEGDIDSTASRITSRMAGYKLKRVDGSTFSSITRSRRYSRIEDYA